MKSLLLFCATQLLLQVSVSASVGPFFDSNVDSSIETKVDENLRRKLQHLKSMVSADRSLYQYSLDEPGGGSMDVSADAPVADSEDSPPPPAYTGNDGGGVGLISDDSGPTMGGKGKGGTGKGKGGKGKGGKKSKGKGKGGKGKGGKGDCSSSKSSKSGKGKGKGSSSKSSKSSSSYDYDCESDDDDSQGGGNGGGQRPTTDFQFVLIRNEVGTPSSEATFGQASMLGLNGYVYDLGPNNQVGTHVIGVFTGVCTVTGATDNALLCRYEIYLYTEGDYEVAGVLVQSPVTDNTSTGLVTGAEYDFGKYTGGTMTTIQDQAEPYLYAYLSLY